MKKLGFYLIAIGIGILLFVLYTLFIKDQGIISPVPDSQGVKVLYITPGK